MRRKTENYNLNKSDGLQVDFYENMEIIDAELKRLDDKIGQGGGQGQGNLRCSGVFDELSIPARVWRTIIPKVTDGDTLMVEGEKFITPSSGLYLLHLTGPSISANIQTYSFITWYASDGVTSSRVGSAFTTNMNMSSCTAVKWMQQGEYFIVYDFADGTVTRGQKMQFEFVLLK